MAKVKTEIQKEKYNAYMKQYMANKRSTQVLTEDEKLAQQKYIREYMRAYRKNVKKPKANLEAGDIYNIVQEIEGEKNES